MEKRENVQMAVTAGQLLELGAAVLKALPHDMDPGTAQHWIGDARGLKKFMRGLLPPQKENEILLPSEVKYWQDFYEIFGINCDFSQLAIPRRPTKEKWQLLVIADVKLEQLFVRCQQLFPCWRWTNEDLDSKIVGNERSASDSTYAIWVKDEQEADEKLKNMSANDVKRKNLATETLAERLVHELVFFEKTGKHLDVNNVTLCAGSRSEDGSVPDVSWDGGKLSVSWYYPAFASDRLRARQVVSL